MRSTFRYSLPHVNIRTLKGTIVIAFIAWVSGLIFAAVSLERLWRYNVLRGAWRAQRQEQEDPYGYVEVRIAYSARAEKYLVSMGFAALAATFMAAFVAPGWIVWIWLGMLRGSHLLFSRRYNQNAEAHNLALQLVRQWDRDHRAMNR